MTDIETLLQNAAARPRSGPDLPLSLDRARRIRRRRYGSIAFLTVVFLAVSGLGYVGLRGGDTTTVQVRARENGLESYNNRQRGVALQYPSDWHVANTLLTPHLGLPDHPYEIVALGTFPMAPADHNCAQVPVNALEAMSNTDAFVWIGDRPDYATGTLSPRPPSFGPESGIDGTQGDIAPAPAGCLDRPLAGASRRIAFEDQGRSFFAIVAIGRDASPQRQAAAWQVLNSFTVDTKDTTKPAVSDQPAIKPPADRPADCELVSNRSGTLFGCARPSERPRPGQTTLPTGELGAPVYDIGSNTTLIGYIATPAGIGFVPLNLVAQYDVLVACNHVLPDPSAVLTSECRQLLVAQGVPVSQFDGR